MASMHENVQQRAGQNEEVRQQAERMRPVLGKQKERGDRQKADGNDPRF